MAERAYNSNMLGWYGRTADVVRDAFQASVLGLCLVTFDPSLNRMLYEVWCDASCWISPTILTIGRKIEGIMSFAANLLFPTKLLLHSTS